MLAKRLKSLLVVVAIVATAYLASSAQTVPAPKKPEADKQAQSVKHGQYLVLAGGCNDCHSPKVFTAQGPLPDTTKLLSGAPAGSSVPAVPAGVLAPDKWGCLGSNDMTTWAGPWGISFASNLTPDWVTGSGAWTEDAFIKAMRKGKHLGVGRDILPPMPLSTLPDEDLRAIFAYLRTLKPIENMVHLPIPPAGK